MSPTLLSTPPTRHRPRFHELEVTAVDRLTPGAVAISFAVPDELAQEFAFEPGQHLTLRATVDGQDVRRSYSICRSRSEALRRKEIRIASAEVPGGVMSTWLNREVQPGDRIQVMSPLGSFTCPLDPERAKHHVAIAAGSGITPVLSLLTSALEEEPQSRVRLIFGNRRTDSIMFLEELEDLKNAYPGRVHLMHVLSREAQDIELFSGRIDRDKLQRLTDTLVPVDDVDEWYLCGPFEMVENARKLLRDNGIDEAHVHHEVFHVEDGAAPVRPVVEVAPGAPPEAVVTVNLDGRTTRIEMASREETILDATLRERPDAPFSCTGGVCGTCRARVVEGEVRMDRNYALEPDEVAAGVVLACQSHPVTDEVRLDYDA
ncbi:phenylacetate-CoA oxygenase/reductase subunit PaaK [Calidifontibacter sp. DB0510]|uniref:Phenylacetate-CoA oxygenase/reductase subunit PaaK n=1 Tax=Metallococcus carri TaxID=1656884 RepID=A0A967B736_9MICO|nr:1,2-phenylacetyl-CoA epoxidase subunit PaaE [Metallococcus carri]NHN55931.1 phenylacetate-CoA oxygenase/reductase subunit PaaK [Metallococcus carri]NOP38381.1 phenylacetate-CoA oxygenase/reductase subunit PaaK [Calidifontibacter sp. DB2511S]